MRVSKKCVMEWGMPIRNEINSCVASILNLKKTRTIRSTNTPKACPEIESIMHVASTKQSISQCLSDVRAVSGASRTHNAGIIGCPRPRPSKVRYLPSCGSCQPSTRHIDRQHSWREVLRPVAVCCGRVGMPPFVSQPPGVPWPGCARIASPSVAWAPDTPHLVLPPGPFSPHEDCIAAGFGSTPSCTHFR